MSTTDDKIRYFSNKLNDLLNQAYETGWLSGKAEASQGKIRTPEFERYQIEAIHKRNCSRDELIALVTRFISDAERLG